MPPTTTPHRLTRTDPGSRLTRTLLHAGPLGLLLFLAVAAAAAPADRAAHERGRVIWNFHCYFCHGYSGDAATLAASYLDPPPRNFLATSASTLARDTMIDAVTRGRPGTAMRGFADRLDGDEIAAVVDFVRDEFMTAGRSNTRYHTSENGWSDHDRYVAAYPFATGELALDTPWEELSPAQADGKRLFLASCVTCHDHGRVNEPGPSWSTRPLSYPRAGYSHRAADAIDAVSSASPYAVHDVPPDLPADADSEIRLGARLFLDNCAFCHAADGTGKNWIGRFMEPHPRNLTDRDAMRSLPLERLRAAIRDGLPETSMPAWKHVLEAAEIEALAAYVDRVLRPQDDR